MAKFVSLEVENVSDLFRNGIVRLFFPYFFG